MASLTSAQMEQLKQLAEESKGNNRMPAARLMRFGAEWNVDYSDLAREYVSVSLAAKQQEKQRKWDGFKKPEPQRPVGPLVPAAATAAPPPETRTALPPSYLSTLKPVMQDVTGIQAPPDAVAVQGSNWVLIAARLRKGLNPSDLGRALNPPMPRKDYLRIEEGRFLPSAHQAAQLCTILEVPIEEVFALAGPEMTSARATHHKGFSVVGVLRVRNRLTMKALIEQIEIKTGVKVPTAFLSKIERNAVDPANLDEVLENFTKAIGAYFDIPPEWVFRQVPNQLVQQAAANVKRLHEVLKATYKELQRVEADDVPYLLTSGGETK